MSMKPPKNEPQSALAGNLCSAPKDVGENASFGNLVSNMKPAEESAKTMPCNVLVGGCSTGTVKPG